MFVWYAYRLAGLVERMSYLHLGLQALPQLCAGIHVRDLLECYIRIQAYLCVFFFARHKVGKVNQPCNC